MPLGLEVYTDTDVIQVGKQLDLSFITTFKTVTEIQNASSSLNWTGICKMLQTDGAELYAYRASVYCTDIPFLKNYSANSRWCRMNYRSLSSGTIAPTNFGLEVYDSTGKIEFNSSIKPLRVLDYFSGFASTNTGTTGVEVTVLAKNYNVPIMVMLDIVPHVTAKLKVVASANGQFKVSTIRTNDGVGNGQTNNYTASGWRYSFLVLDATGY